MSADQTIIAWRNNEEAVGDNSAGAEGDITDGDDQIQHLAVESDEAGEAGDDLPQTVTETGTLSSSRTVSIGSYDGAGAPGGVEDDKKTAVRLQKTSLCSTLSSGDQPYLSLISSETVSERDPGGG